MPLKGNGPDETAEVIRRRLAAVGWQYGDEYLDPPPPRRARFPEAYWARGHIVALRRRWLRVSRRLARLRARAWLLGVALAGWLPK